MQGTMSWGPVLGNTARSKLPLFIHISPLKPGMSCTRAFKNEMIERNKGGTILSVRCVTGVGICDSKQLNTLFLCYQVAALLKEWPCVKVQWSFRHVRNQSTLPISLSGIKWCVWRITLVCSHREFCHYYIMPSICEAS